MRFTLFTLNGYMVQAGGATHLVTMDDPRSVGLELGDELELALPDIAPVKGRVVGYWAHADQPPPASKKLSGPVPPLDAAIAEPTPPPEAA